MSKDAGELFRQGFKELNDAAIVVRYHAPRTPTSSYLLHSTNGKMHIVGSYTSNDKG